MTVKIRFFNSEEAAKILGVNVSTIKRWTENGDLECIKTAGGHRKFLMEHLSAFVEKNKKKNSKINLFTLENEADIDLSYRILKGDFQYLGRFVLEHSLVCNREKVQQVVNGLYLGQYPLYKIYDAIITPVLHQIGYMWAEKELSVVQEHLASQTIKDCLIRLQGIIRRSDNPGMSVFCLTPSRELHDIALKMVDHILESRGFTVHYSGQMTPVERVDEMFERYGPKRLYLSSTYVPDLEELQNEINRYCDLALQYRCDVYLGGRSFDVIDLSHPAIKKRLYTFEDVYTY
jgi:MerR family transcriptional regulator, light-induced transcriptional regulator